MAILLFGAAGIAALVAWVFITETNPGRDAAQSGGNPIARTAGRDLVPGALNLFASGAAATVLTSSTIGRDWAWLIDEGAPVPNLTGDLATRILAAEGGPARNPSSSAAGYGQFLRGTWLDLFGRTYPDLARKLSTEQILALRDVKPLAADLTRQYARENAERLSREGVPASDAVLLLAHAVGPAGAASIIAAPSASPIRELLSPEAIAANPQFATLTASSLRQWAANRIGADAGAQPVQVAARRPVDPVFATGPSEDFRVDGGQMASAVVHRNRARIAHLQQAVAVLSSADSRDYRLAGRRSAAKASPGKSAATETVFAALQALATKPDNERLQYFLKYARQPERIPPSILGRLALVLIDKLEEENAILVHRAQQLRGEIKVRSK